MIYFYISLPMLAILTIAFGHQAFATITECPGFNGHKHIYYDLSVIEFASYNITIAVIAISIFLSQIIILEMKYIKQVKYLIDSFLILILMIIISESYFNYIYSLNGKFI